MALGIFTASTITDDDNYRVHDHDRKSGFKKCMIMIEVENKHDITYIDITYIH